jgi:hypothetical protein
MLEEVSVNGRLRRDVAPEKGWFGDSVEESWV